MAQAKTEAGASRGWDWPHFLSCTLYLWGCSQAH